MIYKNRKEIHKFETFCWNISPKQQSFFSEECMPTSTCSSFCLEKSQTCSIYHKVTNIYFTYLKLLTKYLLSSIFFYYRANILMFSMSIRIIPRKAVPLLITTPEAMNVANEPSLKIWPSSFQLWTKKVYVVYFLKTIFPFF